MKLILTRHTKSDWDDPLLDDHDRPLNGRGRRSAPLLGDWLAAQGHVPDTALVSTALRAQETADLMLAKLGTRQTSIGGLYLAPAFKIIEIVRAQGRGDTLVVCHNPGIADCAEALVGNPPDHPQFFRYPTGATLVVDFAITSWSDLKEGTGRVIDFTVPRDLEAASQ